MLGFLPGGPGEQPWQDRAVPNSYPGPAHSQAPRAAPGSGLLPKWNLLSWLLLSFFLIRKSSAVIVTQSRDVEE